MNIFFCFKIRKQFLKAISFVFALNIFATVSGISKDVFAQTAKENTDLPLIFLPGMSEEYVKKLRKRKTKDELEKYEGTSSRLLNLRKAIFFSAKEFAIKENLLPKAVFNQWLGGEVDFIKKDVVHKIKNSINRGKVSQKQIDNYLEIVNLYQGLFIQEVDKIIAVQQGEKPPEKELQKLIPFFYPREGDELKQQKPKDWISSLYLKFEHGRCSSTLIGPRVLLTAAHCVERQRQFLLSVNNIKISIECTLHPNYFRFRKVSALDFALCLLNRPLPNFAILPRKETLILSKEKPNWEIDKLLTEWKLVALRPERLNISNRKLIPKRSKPTSFWLVLTGYGCTAWKGNLGGNNDKLRAGLGRMSGLSDYLIWVGTQRRRDSSVLCAGDSGGGVYQLIDLNEETENSLGRRLVVGINAGVLNYRGRSPNISFIAKTSSKPFIAFLRWWRRKNNTPKICGIDKNIKQLCHE